VSASRSYLLGLTATAVAGLLVVVVAPASVRSEIAGGVLVGLLVQAPLGWWTLRSIGRESFQLVWIGGMLVRLVVVVLAALVLAGEFRWDPGALLLALVVTLLVLMLVETATAVREHSRSK
jgi:hypothetical protein